MREHYVAQDERLANDVDNTVDTAVEELQQYLYSSNKFTSFKLLQALALRAVGITPDRLEWMAVHDDRNSQYTLYWAELTALLMKVLGRTIDKQLH